MCYDIYLGLKGLKMVNGTVDSDNFYSSVQCKLKYNFNFITWLLIDDRGMYLMSISIFNSKFNIPYF